jgi:predicted Fe-Mo cluster-binding NifX family protein
MHCNVALTTWNGRISPVLDVARQVLLVDVRDGCATARREETLPGTDPQAQAARLMALGPSTLICGAVSRPMADLLAAANIRVVPFTAGPVEDVLAAWLTGRLPDPALSMPGCGGRNRGRHRRGAGGRNGRGCAPGLPPAWGRNGERNRSMKIAITAAGTEMTSGMDPRFGRAKTFVVVDTDSDAWSVHDNAQNLNAPQGAGIQSAETVARLGAQAVVTGHVGPKALRVLQAAGIKVYLAGEGTVADAARRFKAGELPEVDSANVEGHWA